MASSTKQKPFCSIGDCIVHRGMPLNRNPYGCRAPKDPRHPDVQPYQRSFGLSGEERRKALHAFRDGENTSAFTFWYAPAGGGAFQIVSPGVVLWDGGASDRETARAFDESFSCFRSWASLGGCQNCGKTEGCTCNSSDKTELSS